MIQKSASSWQTFGFLSQTVASVIAEKKKKEEKMSLLFISARV